MAGFDRYDKILKLFSPQQGSLTVAQVAQSVAAPASTVYRTVRELVAAGFLESAAGSHFRLGPAFIEYNRTINETDPLIRSGVEHLHQLASILPLPGATVLARLYGTRVMCVADARSQSFTRSTSFQRGQPMPITRGATSRAILAQVKGKRLDRLLTSAALQIEDLRTTMKGALKEERRARLSVTRNEVDDGLVGCAVPLHNKPLGIEASLSCIFEDSADFDAQLPEITKLLWLYAARIETRMQSAFERMTMSGIPSQ